VFSLAWFVVLQLFILPENAYQSQVRRLMDRLQKD
jgi:hypothetical protein